MKLYEIHISESINKVLLEHSHSASFMYCLWLQWKLNTHNRDHMAKPKLFTIWPFPEKCLPIPDLNYDTISCLWFYLDPRRFCFPCINHFWLWCIGCSNPTRRSNQSILKEINPEYSLEGLMLKLKLQYFGHLMQRANSLEKTLMLGKIEGRRGRDQ